MKKKHLRALKSIKNWLNEDTLDEKLRLAFDEILRAIELKSDPTEGAQKELPPPGEIKDDPMAIAIYSDGGCRGNPGPGAYAFVIQDHSGKVLGEGMEFESHTTNNRMELSWPIRGLKELKTLLPEMGRDPLLTKVKVITDSKYVVDGMKSWIANWKARGWKKADNKVPENVELWQELDEVSGPYMEVAWEWVKGHKGHPQNEYCDMRANQLMDENS